MGLGVLILKDIVLIFSPALIDRLNKNDKPVSIGAPLT
jgi:hypothetical protein